MILTRKNIRAGRPLSGFPLVEENGMLGYKLGYCGCGCNEPVLLRTIDSQEVLAHLFHSTKQYKKLIVRLAPKVPVRKRFVKWLIGRLGEYPVISGDNLATN